MPVAWKKVEFKLAQADRALKGLSSAKSREEFYDGLAHFLSDARSAVFILAFQYGLREFVIGEKTAGTNRHKLLSDAERKKRQSFDVWLKRAGTRVRTHRLKIERDSDVHREGTSSARFRLPPGAGLLLEPGEPMETPLVSRHGGFGLPLEGPRSEDFYFQFDTTRPAVAVCREYLALIQSLIASARAHV